MNRPFLTIFFLVGLVTNKYCALGCLVGNLIWSRNHESFIPLENVSTFRSARTSYCDNSRELETHNFRAEVLKLTSFKIENVVDLCENNTKVTGIIGELWTLLSEYLNFTILPIRHAGELEPGVLQQSNKSSVDYFDMLEQNGVQIILRTAYFDNQSRTMTYTIPVWTTRYRLYIKPESGSNSGWIIHMFSRTAWCSIFLIFIILSVLGFSMQRISVGVSRANDLNHDVHDHLFYTFATFCCQGFVPDSIYSHIRILEISKKIFAWLLLTIVSSQLISWLKNQYVQPPFRDLETMFTTTDYNVITLGKSLIQEKFEKEIAKFVTNDQYKNRIYYTNSLHTLYEEACWGKRKYAIFAAADLHRAYGRLICNLVATGKSYYPTWIAAGVSKTFKYRRTLDIGILKFMEFGLLDGLKNRWLANRMSDVDAGLIESVNFNQVSTLFVMLSIGMIATVVVFVLENVLYVYYENRYEIRSRRFFNSLTF